MRRRGVIGAFLFVVARAGIAARISAVLSRRFRFRARKSTTVILLVAPLLLTASAPGWAAATTFTIKATEGALFSGEVAQTDNCRLFSATIDWGDGHSSDRSSVQGGIGGSHTYAEEGTYHGVVTYSDDCTPSGTARFEAQVADAPLTVAAVAVKSTAGQTFSGPLATLSDADPAGMASDYRVQIDWGDGVHTAGSIGSGSGGGFTVRGSHTYAAPGSYQLAVTISDAGGASTIVHGTATVQAAAARASFTVPSGPALVGDSVAFDASASRPPGAEISSFSWTLNGRRVALCDGSTSLLETRFLFPGSYSMKLTVTDAAASVTTATHSLDVKFASGSSARTTYAAAPGMVAPTRLHVVRTEPVFACARGPGDPILRIVPGDVLPSPGPGCQTQVEAGIADAVGCLTEHYVQMELESYTYNDCKPTCASGHIYQLYQPKEPQTLEDMQTHEAIPDAESRILLDDIWKYYVKNCFTIKDCPQVDGYQNYEPPSLGGGSNPPSLGGSAFRTLASASWPPIKAPSKIIPDLSLLTPCSEKPEGPDPKSVCLDLWVSTGPVAVNGVEYVPQGNASILVAPQFNLVLSNDAVIDIGALRAGERQPLNYELPPSVQDPDNGFQALDVADLPALLTTPQARKEFGSAGGFPTAQKSGLHLSFTGNYTATVNFEVQLPSIFSDGSGDPVTVKVYGRLSDSQAFQVLYGYLGSTNGGVNVDFGPVQIKDFAVCFRHQASSDPTLDPCPDITKIPDSFGPDFWTVTGDVHVGPKWAVVFRGSPPQGCVSVSQLGIGFNSSGGFNLVFAGAGLQTPGVTIVPGVTFNSLYASFDASPQYDRVGGCAEFAAAGLVHLTGDLFAVFAKNGNPYTITGNDLPGVMQVGNPPAYPYTNTWAFGVGGTLSLSLPVVGDVQLGQGYALLVGDPAALFFGASADYSLPVGYTYANPPDTGIAVSGGVDGGIGLGNGFPWLVEGKLGVIARVDLPVKGESTIFDGSVDALVSNDPNSGVGGIAVCGTASIFGDSVSGGIAVPWSDMAAAGAISPYVLLGDIHLADCHDQWFTMYKANVASVRSLAAKGAARTLRVPQGTKAVQLYLSSPGGAPDVTLTGPRGIDVSTATAPTGRLTSVGGVEVARLPALDATYLLLQSPPAGVYTLRLNPGSPPLRELKQSDAVAPSIEARVTGRGFRRRLVYNVKPEPAQLVTFIERSAQAVRVLGSTRGGRGSIAFNVVAGYGRRQIVAEVFASSAPATTLPVASYLAPSLQRLSRVPGLRVRRNGAQATISFGTVPGARLYAVYLALDDGARRAFVTSARRLTVRAIFFDTGGKVRVRALGDGLETATGPPATATLEPAVRIRRAPGRR